METQHIINNHNYNIFGVMHTPPSDLIQNPTAGIIFCHPFAEEKMISHRVMVNLARSLAKERYYVLRFDYMGNGDSDGRFEDSTVDTMLSDIACAVEFLRKKARIDKMSLLGVRLGASLACIASEMIEGIDMLIMVNPIIKGDAYIYQCLRSNVATQMATYGKVIKTREKLIEDLMCGELVNIDGYLLSKEMYDQIMNINLIDNIKSRVNQCSIIRILDKLTQREDTVLHEMLSIYRNNGCKTHFANINDIVFWTDLKILNPVAKNLNDSIYDIMQDVI